MFCFFQASKTNPSRPSFQNQIFQNGPPFGKFEAAYRTSPRSRRSERESWRCTSVVSKWVQWNHQLDQLRAWFFLEVSLSPMASSWGAWILAGATRITRRRPPGFQQHGKSEGCRPSGWRKPKRFEGMPKSSWMLKQAYLHCLPKAYFWWSCILRSVIWCQHPSFNHE